MLVAAHAAAERLGAAPLAPSWSAGAPRAGGARRASRRRAGDEPGADSGSPAASARCSGWSPSGLTNREIARTLFVTEKTAGAHVSSILGKLRVRSRLEAATAAQRLGLL